MRSAALVVGLVIAVSAMMVPSSTGAATRPSQAIRVALVKLDRAARVTRGATRRRTLVLSLIHI